MWLVNDDMTVSKKAITLDDQAANALLIVLDGLESHQRIISAGAAYMHEGMKIRVS